MKPVSRTVRVVCETESLKPGLADTIIILINFHTHRESTTLSQGLSSASCNGSRCDKYLCQKIEAQTLSQQYL